VIGTRTRLSLAGGRIDFGEFRVKLLTSIVAIAAIDVLEVFMNFGLASGREPAWIVGILIAFVPAALVLAIVNRISLGDHG